MKPANTVLQNLSELESSLINGIMPLALRPGKVFRVAAGPYLSRLDGSVGVRLASEINRPFDIEVPCIDFGTPKMVDMQLGVEAAVKVITKGYLVYAGCMGGVGRTGTFLACLAKAFGEQSPVYYVRTNYLSHAVETQGQRELVADFEPTRRTLSMIKWARLKSYVGLQSGLLSL